MATKYVKAIDCADKISEVFGIPLYDLIDVFAEIPPADVAEVKHGKWVKSVRCNHVPYRIKNPEKWVMCRCSVCGYSNGRRINDNYCPNCGAKMDGRKTNEI